MAVYSFIDVAAAINGPGGSFQLGYGSGNAEEGITVEMTEDKSTMNVGADGSVMFSLHAGNAGKATVRLQKVSPVNAMLSDLYNTQRASSALWGQNTIVLSNPVSGDTFNLAQVAFTKHPNMTWAKEGGMIDWEFVVGVVDPKIGPNTAGALF